MTKHDPPEDGVTGDSSYAALRGQYDKAFRQYARQEAAAQSGDAANGDASSAEAEYRNVRDELAAFLLRP